jgi:hypothetical protein
MSHKAPQGRLCTMLERQSLNLFTEMNVIVEEHVVLFMFKFFILITFLFLFNKLIILNCNLSSHLYDNFIICFHGLGDKRHVIP